MAKYNSDPRLSLFGTTASVFNQLTSDLNAPELDYLSLLDELLKKRPFHDSSSSFEADEFELHLIDQTEPGSYGICIDLFKDGSEYGRQADLDGPFREEISSSPNSHLILVTQDGPPALMHNDYFGSVHNTVNDLPAYLAAGYAEVLSFDRAAYIQRALGDLSAGQIDPEPLF